jgi:hypothetical protein
MDLKKITTVIYIDKDSFRIVKGQRLIKNLSKPTKSLERNYFQFDLKDFLSRTAEHTEWNLNLLRKGLTLHESSM